MSRHHLWFLSPPGLLTPTHYGGYHFCFSCCCFCFATYGVQRVFCNSYTDQDSRDLICLNAIIPRLPPPPSACFYSAGWSSFAGNTSTQAYLFTSQVSQWPGAPMGIREVKHSHHYSNLHIHFSLFPSLSSHCQPPCLPPPPGLPTSSLPPTSSRPPTSFHPLFFPPPPFLPSPPFLPLFSQPYNSSCSPSSS